MAINDQTYSHCFILFLAFIKVYSILEIEQKKTDR